MGASLVRPRAANGATRNGYPGFFSLTKPRAGVFVHCTMPIPLFHPSSTFDSSADSCLYCAESSATRPSRSAAINAL